MAKLVIDPETQKKIVVESIGNPKDLIDLVHPSQLEKRFGGAAERPENFWPPQMGAEFNTEEERRTMLTSIPEDDYANVVEKNPLLMRHPAFIKEPAH